MRKGAGKDPQGHWKSLAIKERRRGRRFPSDNKGSAVGESAFLVVLSCFKRENEERQKSCEQRDLSTEVREELLESFGDDITEQCQAAHRSSLKSLHRGENGRKVRVGFLGSR